MVLHELTSDLRFAPIESPGDLRQFSELLNRTFPVPAGKNFFDDFPVWDAQFKTDPNLIARIGVFQGPRLISAAGVKKAQMKTPRGVVPVALIGAVVTDPEWRGHGFASKTVALALQWAREHNVSIALLWGSEHSLYKKLGFELCGKQMDIPLAELSLPLPGPFPNPVLTGWNLGIFDLLKKRPQGLAIVPSDLPWIESHKNIAWYWTGDAASPRAYAGFGKGIDLQNRVHEWGGDPTDLKKILAHILAQNPGASLLGSPELIRDAGFQVNAPVDFLCMARVIDPVRVFNSYYAKASLYGALNPEGWKLTLSGPEWEAQLSEGAIAQLFFGPNSPNEESLKNYFPLPLWIWGIDAA